MDIVLELKRGWIYVLGGTSHSAQPEGPSFTIFYRQHFSQQQNNLKHSKCNKYRGFTSVGKISNFLWKIKRVCKYFTRKFRMWIFSCEDKMTCTLVTRCPIPSHQPPPPHLFQGLDTVVLTWTGEYWESLQKNVFWRPCKNLSFNAPLNFITWDIKGIRYLTRPPFLSMVHFGQS